MQRIRKIFISALSALLLVALIISAVLFLPKNTETVFAARDNKFTVIGKKSDGSHYDLWQGGKKPFNGVVLNELYLALLGVDNYKDFENAVNTDGDKVFTSEEFRNNNSGNNVSLWFAGKKWDAVYLTKDKTGTSVVLDLWQSADDTKNNTTQISQWANRSSTSNTPTAAYPNNMYSTSLIRVQTLNNGGYMSTSGTALAAETKKDTNSEYARFTMSSDELEGTGIESIQSYLVQPKNMPYQETENNNGNSSMAYSLVNDAYGTDTTAYQGTVKFYNDNFKNYTTKDHYADWQEDYLWLPSLAETGNSDSANQNGLWKTNASLRSTESTGGKSCAWLRSGYVNNAYFAYYLYTSGSFSNDNVNREYVVRPALHLNLTSAAGAAGAVLPEKPTEGLTKEVPYSGDEQEFELPELEGVTYSAVAAGDSTDFFQNDLVAKTKKIVATNAGEYKVEVTPPEDGWKDGTKDPVTFTLKINKAKITQQFGEGNFSQTQNYVYHADDNKYALKLPEIGEEGFPLSLVGKPSLAADDITLTYIIDTHDESGHDAKKAEIEGKIEKANGGDPSELEKLGSWTAYKKGGKCGDYDFDVNKPLGYCVIFKAEANDNFETLYGYFSVHIYNETLTIYLTDNFDTPPEVEYGEVTHTQASLRDEVLKKIDRIEAANADGSVTDKSDLKEKLKDEAEAGKFRFYFCDAESGGTRYDVSSTDDGKRLAAGKTYYLFLEYIDESIDEADRKNYITFEWKLPGGAVKRPSFTVTPREIEVELDITGTHKYKDNPPTSWATATPSRTDGEWYGTPDDNDISKLKIQYKFKKSDGTGEEYTALSKDMPAGEYTVTATSGNTNYSFTATGSYTVGKAAYTIKFEAASEEYTGEEIKHEISSLPDGVTATYSYQSADTTTYPASATAPTNAGTYKVTATFTITDSENYEKPEDITVDLTITPKKLTFVLKNSSGEYTGSPHGDIDVDFETLADGDSLTKGVDYDLKFEVDGEGELGEGDIPQGKGSYTVTVTLKDTVKNYAMEDGAEQTYTIGIGGLAKPTGDDIDETYKGDYYELKLTGFDKDTMSGSTTGDGAEFDENTGVFKAKNVGTYTLTVSLADKDNTQWSDKTSADIEFTIEISKAKLTFTISPSSGEYTGSEYDVTVDFGMSLKGADTLAADDYKISYAADPTGTGVLGANNKPQGVGKYTVTVELNDTDATKNYQMADGAQATFTISAGGIDKPQGENIDDNYKGSDYVLTLTGYDSDKMSYSITPSDKGAAFDPASGEFTAKNAGEYKLSITLNDTQYVWSAGGNDPVEFTIKINKVALTVTADDLSVVYGTMPTYTVTYSGFVAGESEASLGYTATASSTYSFANGIGNNFPITVNLPSVTLDNYAVTPVAGTLTVTPKAISLKISDGGHGYSAAPSAITFAIDEPASGVLVGSDTVAQICALVTFRLEKDGAIVAHSNPAALGVGVYDICANDGDYFNYTVTFTKGEYTVSSAAVAAPTADPNAEKFVYNGTQQTYTPAGFDGDTMTISGHTRTAAGTQKVRVTLKDENTVFVGGANFVEFDFTIQKAEIIVRKGSNEWFDESFEQGSGDDFTVSFLEKVGSEYKYIVTADGCEVEVKFDPTLKAENAGAGAYTASVPPTIPRSTTAGRYVIYYEISDPAGNHETLHGEWRVEIADRSGVLAVIFNKRFTAPYGMNYNVDQLFKPKSEFEDGISYISVYKFEDEQWKEQDLTWFKGIVDVNVSKKHNNYYGNQNTGTYDISFTLKSGHENEWTIMYKLRNDDYDSNEDQFVIEKAKLQVIWGNLTFEWNDKGDYTISPQLATTGYSEPLKLEWEITKDGKPVAEISESGSYLVTARLKDDYGNFEIINATQIIEVKAAPTSDDGLPVWVIALIAAGAAVAVIIAVIAIIVVMKKKKAKEEVAAVAQTPAPAPAPAPAPTPAPAPEPTAAEPKVIYRDINSDNDGFYDAASDGNGNPDGNDDEEE